MSGEDIRRSGEAAMASWPWLFLALLLIAPAMWWMLNFRFAATIEQLRASNAALKEEVEKLQHQMPSIVEHTNVVFENAAAEPRPERQPATANSFKRVKGRKYLPASVTTAMMVDARTGKTSFQGDAAVAAYIGLWMEHTGQVKDVAKYLGFSTVRFFWPFKKDKASEYKSVAAMFSDKDDPQLAVLGIGHTATVIGRISNVDDYTVHLDECEFPEVLDGGNF